MNTEAKKKLNFFVQGAISSEQMSKMLDSHKHKTEIGAHQFFLGQVRADSHEGKKVKSIFYSAHEEMALQEIAQIREEAIEQYKLSCAHVLHSLGEVKTGEICFLVMVSAPHRQGCFEAIETIVNRIKKEVPVFGKEMLEDGTYTWKQNKI